MWGASGFQSYVHVYGAVFLETIYKFVLVKQENTYNLNAVKTNLVKT